MMYIKMMYKLYNPNMGDMELGSFIKAQRKIKSMSRKVLADKVNVSEGHINNIERGDRRPSSDLIFAISRELNLDSNIMFNLLSGNVSSTQIEEDKPELFYFLDADPNISSTTKRVIHRLIEEEYEEAKRNAEELRRIIERSKGTDKDKPTA